MKTLMYSIAPDDDFPDEFCAIRQGSGEHWFYTPAGESASWALLRAESENAKLRELVRIAGTYCVNGLCGKDDGCPLYLGKPYCALHDRMRELGVEVDE